MTSGAASCAQVSQALVDGEPRSEAVRAHVEGCLPCRHLAAVTDGLARAAEGDVVPLLTPPTLAEALQSRRRAKQAWVAGAVAASALAFTWVLSPPASDAPEGPLAAGEPLEATFARVDRLFERNVVTEDFTYRRFGALPEWLSPDSELSNEAEEEEEQTP